MSFDLVKSAVGAVSEGGSGRAQESESRHEPESYYDAYGKPQPRPHHYRLPRWCHSSVTEVVEPMLLLALATFVVARKTDRAIASLRF